MYPGKQAKAHPDRAAVIVATSGETIIYAELEARSNRLVHLFAARGLNRLDHYSIYMEKPRRSITRRRGRRSRSPSATAAPP